MTQNGFELKKVRNGSGVSKSELTGEHWGVKKCYGADRGPWKINRYKGNPKEVVLQQEDVRNP